HLRADGLQAFEVAQGVAVVDALAVGSHDDVADLEAGCCRGGIRVDTGHDRAARVVQAETVGNARVHVLGVDAQAAAVHFAGGLELAHDVAGQARGNRETQADVAGHRAARIEAGSIDAHQLP